MDKYKQTSSAYGIQVKGKTSRKYENKENHGITMFAYMNGVNKSVLQP